MKYDFGGWATRNDLKCADGRTIRRDAFKDDNGAIRPLVWQHQHDDPANVLGHAVLENRPEGVYAYCTFNDTPAGKNAKELVRHGDISALSIYANKLKQRGGDVLHGVIREVSLVLAGANPGAFIDDLAFEHSGMDGDDGEAVIYTGEVIQHSYDDSEEQEMLQQYAMQQEAMRQQYLQEQAMLQQYAMQQEAMRQQALAHAAMQENAAKEDGSVEPEKTVKDVFNELTEEQKNVVYYMIGEAIDKASEDNQMKHNVFEGDNMNNTLSHADLEVVFNDAKTAGSLKESVNYHLENGVLAHAIDTTGMTVSSNVQTYGVNDPSFLFPEARALNNPPEWIKRDTDWVKKVMDGVHHTPFSRIKSVFANITEDEARAKGYIKGHQKTEEVFSLLKRTTTPQTIYKKQKLDRDDIIDITDFDVVAWIKSEMRIMLDEELARAILIGDGRLGSSDDKISEDHIRPIATDKPLFTIQASVSNFATTPKNMIKAAIRARKDYKGSGNPVLFTTEEVLTELLLIEDAQQHFMYKSKEELATVMRVSDIVTVPVLENFKIDNYPVYGVIVNLSDYNVGADKGGAVNLFDDFDIDYNQQKYLIETRCSGALIKPYSAIVLKSDTAVSNSNPTT